MAIEDTCKRFLYSEEQQFNALKIFKHLDHVNDFRKGKITFPISIDLSVSNFCNQRCIWCYYRGYLESARTMLDKKLLYNLVEELSSLGIKGINFTGGGEPVTHPALVDIMEFAYSKGINVGLITNGVLLDENKIKRLTKIAKFIRVSLNSSTQEGYMRFHNGRKEDFARLVKALKLLGVYSKNTGCLTGVLFLLGPKTQEEFLKTIYITKKSGLKFIEARLIKSTSCLTSDCLKWEDETIGQKARAFADDNFKVIIREELFRARPGYKKGYRRCYIYEFVTSISAEGDVYICCEFEGNKKYAFGNIKSKSFKDIWLSEERKEVIKKLDLNKCFACCKGDGLNRLFSAIDNIQHPNFI